MGLLDQAKANTDDQTKGDDFKDFVAPSGPTMARFIGYVEVGKRKQKPWKGTAKPDASEVRFTFELLSPKNIREIEVDGEKITTSDVIGCKVAIKSGEKAAFTKLLNRMAYGREGIINFAQMLGEAFLINVIHAQGKDRDGNEKTYANMKDAEFNWTITAPVQVDALTAAVTTLPVPEPTLPLRLLLWDNPTTEQWQSVFIDGERTIKNEDGTETIESKNWLQRDIVENAINFANSPLSAMLNGLSDADLAIPGDVGEPGGAAADQVAAVAAAADKLSAAESAAQAAIVESNKALEQAGDVATVGKGVVKEMIDEDAKALAEAKAIIAKLTGG